MVNKVIFLIRRNVGFFVALATAASAFMASLLAKNNLSPEVFGNVAIFLLVANTLYVVGSYGAEQVVLRFTEFNEVVIIRREVLTACAISILIAPAASWCLFSYFKVIDSYSLSFLMLSILVPLLSLASSVLKVGGRVASYYFVTGIWKFIFLGVVVFFLCFDVDAQYLDSYVFYSVFSGGVVSLFFFKNFDLVLVGEWLVERKLIVYLGAAVVSTTSFMVFDSVDRFSINNTFDVDVFGDYFFLWGFIYAPVGLFCNYMASKKFINYKSNISFSLVSIDYLRCVIIALLISVLFLAAVVVLEFVGFLSFRVDLVEVGALVALFAVIRGGYSIASSAYNAICSRVTLLFTGFLFLLFSSVVFFGLTSFPGVLSLQGCVVFFSFFWLVRTVIYFFVIHKDIKNSAELW